MTSTSFDILFQPGRIGSATIPNRIVMPQMTIATVNALNLREKVFLEDAGLQYERHSKFNTLLGQFLASPLKKNHSEVL